MIKPRVTTSPDKLKLTIATAHGQRLPGELVFETPELDDLIQAPDQPVRTMLLDGTDRQDDDAGRAAQVFLDLLAGGKDNRAPLLALRWCRPGQPAKRQRGSRQALLYPCESSLPIWTRSRAPRASMRAT